MTSGVVAARGRRRAIVILLHDAGSTAQRLRDALLDRPAGGARTANARGAELQFVEAPLEGDPGSGGRTWFSTRRAELWREIARSVDLVEQVVEQAAREVGSRCRVYLGGEGMGFTVAAVVVLHMETRIGGLLGAAPSEPSVADLWPAPETADRLPYWRRGLTDWLRHYRAARQSGPGGSAGLVPRGALAATLVLLGHGADAGADMCARVETLEWVFGEMDCVVLTKVTDEARWTASAAAQLDMVVEMSMAEDYLASFGLDRNEALLSAAAP